MVVSFLAYFFGPPCRRKGATRSERNHGVEGYHKGKEAYNSEGAHTAKAQVFQLHQSPEL